MDIRAGQSASERHLLQAHLARKKELQSEQAGERATSKPVLQDKTNNASIAEITLALGAAVDNEVEENDDEDASVHRPRMSERKRLQHAIFAAWRTNRASQASKEEAKASLAKADERQLSVKSLMAKQEFQKIITEPREYQMELFEKAKNENIIAVLDTGSGKTLIAVLLLKHILDRELEDRAAGKKPRLAFFLVNSVTLVFQQFAVLEANLNQKVDRFCGDMGTDLWNKVAWKERFEKNMVIVCTAEVLHVCLLHSYITMEQISILVFDEAHHAKKNHVYARIIKDFYLREDDVKWRPKIFGMTASPCDAKTDPVEAAKELELLLSSRIATTKDLSLMQKTVFRPDEKIAQYGRCFKPYWTALGAKINLQYGSMPALQRLLSCARNAAGELGEWCADRLWIIALDEAEAVKLERQTERSFLSDASSASPSLDDELQRIRGLKELVAQQAVEIPTLQDNIISPKLVCLRSCLSEEFSRPTSNKCIIFVKERYTARLLQEYFAVTTLPHLKAERLIGTSPGDAGDLKMTFRQQVLTLMKFRKGEINCLIATSIAEEGLDIPDCNIVIRFDLYDTVIQYIQSRGRARHRNSRFVHMLEERNMAQLKHIKNVRKDENVIRKFCESLPEDRLLEGNGSDNSIWRNEDSFRIYKEPSTGAQLTYASSMVLLAFFVSCLPQDREAPTRPEYHTISQRDRFICEVRLPAHSPITFAISPACRRKIIARQAAAFNACLKLREKCYLNEELMPVLHKQLPLMRNAHLAINSKKTNTYDMLTKPSLWAISMRNKPDLVYATIISFSNREVLERPFTPLILLTRVPLPSLPKFPVFPQSLTRCDVALMSLDRPFALGPDQLEMLNSFTLRIFKDLFNKTYEVDETKMPYWLAPMKSSEDEFDADDIGTLLDWQAISFTHSNEWSMIWTSETPNEQLVNRFLVDKWQGGRRYFSDEIAGGLRGGDSVPNGVPHRSHQKNIIDYTVSLWDNARKKLDETWDRNQPVMKCTEIMIRRNILDEWQKPEDKEHSSCYLAPQPLQFSTIPISVAAMAYNFPAIIYRIDSYLISLEACEKLGLTVSPTLALEAFTKDSDNTDEHRTEQIHFQRGMGKNYERLEFIGDVFLKMATTISLFAQFAQDDEFEFHVKRMLMICNKNLFSSATSQEMELFKYIRSKGFSRRTWYPQGIKLLAGKGANKQSEEQSKHQLNDKTIADVCEATIGAALLSHNSAEAPARDMDMAVRAVTAFVNSKNHNARCWLDYYKLYSHPQYQYVMPSVSESDIARQIFEVHDYHFKHPRLLVSAFTHPSQPFSYRKLPSYQRLEFLGDALLDMACVNDIFYRYPDKDPQWLTEHKMPMVSNHFLGALCVKLGFHRHLRHNSPVLPGLIKDYVEEITEAAIQSDGSPNYWEDTKTPPKCLPDIVEAYIGAVFVDSGFNYAEVERFFCKHVSSFFGNMTLYDTFANKHPITHLTNLLTMTFGCNNYAVLADELPPKFDGAPAQYGALVIIHEKPAAEGISSSSKYARVKAATKAVERLEGMAPTDFRKEHACDCQTQTVDKEIEARGQELLNEQVSTPGAKRKAGAH